MALTYFILAGDNYLPGRTTFKFNFTLDKIFLFVNVRIWQCHSYT